MDEEIFTSNFSESLKNSFKSLLDDSSFRTKVNTMLNAEQTAQVMQNVPTEVTAQEAKEQRIEAEQAVA